MASDPQPYNTSNRKNSLIRPQNLFGTTAFWGVILTLIISTKSSVALALEKGKFEPTDFWDIIQALAASLVVILDSYNRDPNIFTDRYLPGRNKEDITQK